MKTLSLAALIAATVAIYVVPVFAQGYPQTPVLTVKREHRAVVHHRHHHRVAHHRRHHVEVRG